MLILITPLIALLPDLIIKQINYNLFPTPAEYIENFRDTIQFQKLINSESRFIEDSSKIFSDMSQKIELIDSGKNKKNTFRKYSRNVYEKKISLNSNPNPNPNIFNTENSDMPLIDYLHKRDRLNYNNDFKIRIDEIQSKEISHKDIEPINSNF
jgi:hypothetical protein